MSTGNKPTVQQAAKQGNPQAIAILLNRQLQPKGITAKLSVKDSCLQIMLEAANVPNQKGLVAAIQKWIDGLGVDSIQRVQIYAKQTGEEIPAWNDGFEVFRQLEEPKIASTVNSPTVAIEISKNDAKVEEIDASKLDPALLELAKNGDTRAISELIKNSLQQTDVKVRVTLNKGLLQVVIASSQAPKQDNSVAAIPELVTVFKSTLIHKVKVIGMQETEDSNSSNTLWQQEFLIDKQLFDNPLPIRISDFPSVNSMNETQNISKVSDVAHHRRDQMVERITIMPALVDLVTPLNIFFSIVFAFVLANVFQISWGILIPIYIIVAVLITVYVKSPKGQKEMAKRDKQRQKEMAERDKQILKAHAQFWDDKQSREKESEKAAQIIREEKQAVLVAKAAEEKAYIEMLNRERSNLQNLETNLAEIAIEELMEVRSRLGSKKMGIEVNKFGNFVVRGSRFMDYLVEIPSILSPAIFAVNQFKESKDFAVSDYLSKIITTTSDLFQLLQECTQLEVQSPIKTETFGDVFGGYVGSISTTSPLGKLIGEALPEQIRDWNDGYDYEKVLASIIFAAYTNLGKLNELLEIMQKKSRYRKVSNPSQETITDPFEQISKLKKLKDDGIITEAEFESKKKDLIDRL